MKFLSFKLDSESGLAVMSENRLRGLPRSDPDYPGDLLNLLRQGPEALARAGRILAGAPILDGDRITFLPPLEAPGKIICVGLNYVDHSHESGFEPPAYPTLFGRFSSSLIGHRGAMLRPAVSTQLDYEGELAAIIGKSAKNITQAEALDHVAGYSIFNDGSIRDYQFKAPQWTAGKNFDGTGAFGPYFVTADELPAGCEGLKLETRLNGRVVQSAWIQDMVFSVSSLVSILSEVMTLAPGDVIVTGTPAGVGLARKPPLFMKDGDVCEVEIEKVGTLTNRIRDENAQLQ